MNQVHKENLSSVENALANRQGLDIEIFGMEGIPEDVVQQHNQRIIQNFYTAQAERHAATGNPPPGQNMGQAPAKKLKTETPEELKKRLAEHRARRAAQKAAPANGSAGTTPADGRSPGQSVSFPCLLCTSRPNWQITYHRSFLPQNSPFPPPQQGYPYPAACVPGVAPGYGNPPSYNPMYPPGGAPPAGGFNLPARPPISTPSASNLPQRPSYGAPGGGSTVDELVAAGARQGDDIDNLIRMAEAGIKPGQNADGAEAAPAEKKSKKDKDKNMRMVYADTEVSPEEKLARMPRYAFVPVA